eukprot:4818583-Pleurochrysis_carterae.AAC.1
MFRFHLPTVRQTGPERRAHCALSFIRAVYRVRAQPGPWGCGAQAAACHVAALTKFVLDQFMVPRLAWPCRLEPALARGGHRALVPTRPLKVILESQLVPSACVISIEADVGLPLAWRESRNTTITASAGSKWTFSLVQNLS